MLKKIGNFFKILYDSIIEAQKMRAKYHSQTWFRDW